MVFFSSSSSFFLHTRCYRSNGAIRLSPRCLGADRVNFGSTCETLGWEEVRSLYLRLLTDATALAGSGERGEGGRGAR